MGSIRLNWVRQTRELERFLKSNAKVLHIVGGPQSQPQTFLQVLEQFGSGAERELIVCTIDALNQRVGSPAGAVGAINRALGLPDPDPEVFGTVNVATNLRARSIQISNVNVSVLSDGQMAEVMAGHLMDNLDRLTNIAKLVVVFTQCESMSEDLRRIFWSSLWVPVLKELVDRGAKVIYQFAPGVPSRAENSIPTPSGMTIELPTRLDRSVMKEIADWAIEQGWESDPVAAGGRARGIFDASQDVEALYQSLFTTQNRSDRA